MRGNKAGQFRVAWLLLLVLSLAGPQPGSRSNRRQWARNLGRVGALKCVTTRSHCHQRPGAITGTTGVTRPGGAGPVCRALYWRQHGSLRARGDVTPLGAAIPTPQRGPATVSHSVARKLLHAGIATGYALSHTHHTLLLSPGLTEHSHPILVGQLA